MKKLLLSLGLAAFGLYAGAQESTFTQITSTDQLVEGAEYVIVSCPKLVGKVQYGAFAMAAPKSNGSGFETYELSDNVTDIEESYTIDVEKITVLTLESDGTGWKFKCGDQYLNSATVKKLKLDAAATTFTIAIENGIATISYTGGNIRANHTNGSGGVKGTVTINTYASGQNDIALYKMQGGPVGPVKLDPALSFGEVTDFTANLGETFTAPKLTYATNAEILYESSNEAVAVVDENTGAVELKGAGTTEIKAVAEANDEYKGGSASYTLTVIDPNNLSIYESAKGVDFTFENPDGLNVWSHDNTYGLKGTAYQNNKLNVAEAVAVSPVINLQQYKDAKLCFKNAFNNYKKNNVMISPAEFSGYAEILVRTVGTTEWTSIAEPTAPATFSWTFYDNEPVSLADYSGKLIQIGFKYISTEDVAGTWEVQAISVKGAKAETAKQDAGIAFEIKDIRALLGSAFTAPALTNPNGLDVTYSSSNPEVAAVAADGTVTLIATGTTTITAISAETDLFFEGVASYDLTVINAYNTLEAFYGIGANNFGVIGFDLIVTYVNGVNCYAQTAAGEATLVYGSTSYTAGDVIPAGWEGQYSPFQGLPEIKPAAALPAATETAEFTPAQVSAVSMADLNRIVVLKDVIFAAATASGSTKTNFIGKVGDTEYTFRNNFADVASVEAGSYNVTLAVGCYNTTLQLYPIEYTPASSGIEAIELGNDTVVEYYNLQGVRVDKPANGLYIRRQGNKATKVLIK